MEARVVPAILMVNSLLDNTTAGDGLVTLREAIIAAETDTATDLGDTGSGADSITFDPTLFTTGGRKIDLSLVGDTSVGPSALAVTSRITITGPGGANGLTIGRDAGVSNLRLFRVGSSGNLTLDQLTLSGGRVVGADGSAGTNGAVGRGGAVFKQGSLAVRNSTLIGNTAQGGNGGSGGNGGDGQGGAIFNDVGATLVVTNSTLSSNTAQGGNGGFGTSFSGAPGVGQGGAISNRPSAPFALTNSILSSNSAISGGFGGPPGSGPDLFGSLYGDCNLIQNPNGWLFTSGGTHLITGQPALLGPLGDYGGPTPTLALLPGSPAIGAGTSVVFTTLAAILDASATSITVAGTSGIGRGLYIKIGTEIMLVTDVVNGTTLAVARGQLGTTAVPHTTTGVNVTLAADQRGIAFVGEPDLGAFDSRGFTIAVTSGNGQSAMVTTAFGAPLVVTVTANAAGEPVQGGKVTFTAPASGASADLSGNPASIASGGTASVTATANGTAGVYAVSATAAGIMTPASLSLTNTPPFVSIAFAPSSVPEDGATNLVYTFTRTGATTGSLTVNFSVGGSAAFGTDYTQSGAATFTTTAGTVTIAAGSSTATVTIDPTPDTAVEPDESVVLRVTAGTGYNVASPSVAAGIIENDDLGTSPVLTGVLVNNAAAPTPALTNSRVTSLVLTFDQAVYLDPGAFSLTNGVGTITSGAGGAISVAGGGTTTVTLTFTGTSGVDFGSLADGIWTLTTNMTLVRSASGNVAGTGTTATNNIRRLYGDIDGNGVVNSDDFDQFGNTFGLSVGDPGYLAGFDFDNNGVINSDDVDQFGNRFGVSL